jgi:predicted nucleic acid-binding protein
MFVIDASVYVSRLQQQETHHAESARFLETVMTRGLDVLCPEILLPEVAAAVARGLDDAGLAQRAAAHLRTLPGHRFFAVDRILGGLATQLASNHRLRGCDAVYVALARQEGARLITWDKQQLERAAAVVETLTPDKALSVL